MNLSTLKSLQSRIREATGADRELDAEIAITLGMISGDVAWKITTDATGERIAINSASSTEVLLRDFGRYLSIPRYTTDPDGLGACVALQRSVLPGWTREVREMRDGFWVRLTLDSRVNKPSGMHACETNAHLLAIIAALIAEEEAKEKTDA